ncbi:hypothetical protein G3M48_003525 [Beauveria asiatica]|uniref:Uncharacterized protein n=1 Tax=Beauveria asiatica TaxID=1069075 RepID=A0AAW0S736_9HYPO
MTKPEPKPEPQPEKCKVYKADSYNNYSAFFIEFRKEVLREGQLLGKLYIRNAVSKTTVLPVLPVKDQKDSMLPTKISSSLMNVDFKDAGGDSTEEHGDENKLWAAWTEAERIREKERREWEMQSRR